MPPTYIFTTTPYAKEEIPLGSLVPDIRYPNEDIIKVSVAQKDFSTVIDKDFRGVVEEESQSILQGTIAAVWKTICSIFWQIESKCNFQISAEEARLYSLAQPKAVFEKLCESDHVRKFLQDCHKERVKPVFVIGYRTLVDAKLVQIDRNVSTTSGSGQVNGDGVGNVSDDAARARIDIGREVKDGGSLEFQASGERIFAINYRKVDIKVRSSDLVPSLERQTPTSWLIFSKTRGRPDREAEVIQVSLDDVDYVGESDVVFKNNEASFISLHKDDD